MQNSAQAKTREVAAKALNTSHDTLHKAKTIAREKPELMKAIDEVYPALVFTEGPEIVFFG